MSKQTWQTNNHFTTLKNEIELNMECVQVFYEILKRKKTFAWIDSMSNRIQPMHTLAAIHRTEYRLYEQIYVKWNKEKLLRKIWIEKKKKN